MVCQSVCPTVCRSVTLMSTAKTAKPIEMPFGLQRCSLETLVLVSRRLEDMKNGLGVGLGLEEKVLVLVLVLTKKSRHFQDLDE